MTFQFLPADLVQIIDPKDQSLYIKKQIGKLGLIVAKLTPPEVTSSPNMYKVLVDNRILRLHCLDMKLLSRVK